MPGKRKAPPCSTSTRAPMSLASFDAALDLLACETFTRLESIKTKFEAAAGFDIDDGAVRSRWDDAVKRYWVMKSMDDLCCGTSVGRKEKDRGKGKEKDEGRINGDIREEEMVGDPMGNGESSRTSGRDHDEVDDHGRAIVKPHPGAVVLHGLNSEEEHEWRKWVPRLGDVVLCDTPSDGIWPGKIIDKKIYFTGRTMPKGNHFFAIRIYNTEIEPTLSIKSRLLPLSIRPIAPLLSPASLLSAYNHAISPSSFDTEAAEREYLAADRRAHPGLVDPAVIKQNKSEWNEFVNWVMNERRAEKLRNLAEERERRLRMMASSECRDVDGYEGLGTGVSNGEKKRLAGVLANGTGNRQQLDQGKGQGDMEMVDMSGLTRVFGGLHAQSLSVPGEDQQSGGGKRQRRSPLPLPPSDLDHALSTSSSSSSLSRASNGPAKGLGIFTVPSVTATTPRRTGSPFRARPGIGMGIGLGLSTPTRPLSPRRLEKRRGSGILGQNGYESPRRGSWTPPRSLPGTDEVAPFRRLSNGLAVGSGPGPNGMLVDGWNKEFDFVSPLGPVRAGIVDNTSMSISLSPATQQDAQMDSETPRKVENLNDSADGCDTPRADHTVSTSNSFMRRKSECLESVKEEEEEGDGWTLVSAAGARGKVRPNGANRTDRAGSEPGPETPTANGKPPVVGSTSGLNHAHGSSSGFGLRGSGLVMTPTRQVMGKSHSSGDVFAGEVRLTEMVNGNGNGNLGNRIDVGDADLDL